MTVCTHKYIGGTNSHNDNQSGSLLVDACLCVHRYKLCRNGVQHQLVWVHMESGQMYQCIQTFPMKNWAEEVCLCAGVGVYMFMWTYILVSTCLWLQPLLTIYVNTYFWHIMLGFPQANSIYILSFLFYYFRSSWTCDRNHYRNSRPGCGVCHPHSGCSVLSQKEQSCCQGMWTCIYLCIGHVIMVINTQNVCCICKKALSIIYCSVSNVLIGASPSEPHTYNEYAAAVCMCIYIYVPYVMPYSSIYSFIMAAASEPL